MLIDLISVSLFSENNSYLQKKTMRSGRRKTDYFHWWQKLKDELEGEDNGGPAIVQTTLAPVIWMNATSVPKFYPYSNKSYPSVTPKTIIAPIVNSDDPSLKLTFDGQQLLVEGLGGGAGGTLVLVMLILGIYLM